MAIIICDYNFMEKFNVGCQDEFDELTDEQVADLANDADNRENGIDVFKTDKDLEAAWRTEEVLYPEFSYMRVVPNDLLTF